MIVVVSCILSFNGRREVSSTELDYWLLSRIVINLSMGGGIEGVRENMYTSVLLWYVSELNIMI